MLGPDTNCKSFTKKEGTNEIIYGKTSTDTSLTNDFRIHNLVRQWHQIRTIHKEKNKKLMKYYI